MSKNYIDKKTLEKVLKKWDRAKKSNYATSQFWKTEKDKISKIIGKKAQPSKLLAGVSRLTKTQAELLNRELNIIAKSKISSKYGYDKARKKQRDTLISKGWVSNQNEAKKFQQIISSDIFKKVMDNLEYINYNALFNIVEDEKVTLKKIEKAYKMVQVEVFETEIEKAEKFLNILKKG